MEELRGLQVVVKDIQYEMYPFPLVMIVESISMHTASLDVGAELFKEDCDICRSRVYIKLQKTLFF